MESAAAIVHERAQEAIARYARVQSAAELACVHSWAKGFDWFFRSAEDDRELKKAFRAAKMRINAPSFEKLSQPLQEKALSVLALLQREISAIRVQPTGGIVLFNVRMILQGNYPDELAPPREIARWLDPTAKLNVAACVLIAAVSRSEEEMPEAAVRTAFTMLPKEDQDFLTAALNAEVDSNREGFFEDHPEFRRMAGQ